MFRSAPRLPLQHRCSSVRNILGELSRARTTHLLRKRRKQLWLIAEKRRILVLRALTRENRSLTGFMTLSGIRSPLEFRVFHINGIALHVVLAGPASGKPLIFLHGFPEFWFAWRLQIDHFVSSGYRVIIPDQRGYNLSDKPAGIASYSIDLLARDVVGVLDTVADSKAFVVGHDWGAAVAWYLAARYSERLAAARC